VRDENRVGRLRLSPNASEGGVFVGSARSGKARPPQAARKLERFPRLSQWVYSFLSSSTGQAIHAIASITERIIASIILAFKEVFQIGSLTNIAARERLMALINPEAKRSRLFGGKNPFIWVTDWRRQFNSSLNKSQSFFHEIINPIIPLTPRAEVRRRRPRRHSSVLAPLSARAEVRTKRPAKEETLSGVGVWDSIWSVQKQKMPSDREILDSIGLNNANARLVYDGFARFLPQKGKILEPGTGSGRLLIQHAKRHPEIEAYGVDFSDTALYRARRAGELLGLSNVYFVKGDIRYLPYGDNSFDAVFNEGVLEHFRADQFRQIFAEMIRVTKPGGQIIVSVPNYYSPSGIVEKFFHRIDWRDVEKGGAYKRWAYGYEQPMTHAQLRSYFKEFGLQRIELSGWDPLFIFRWGLKVWNPRTGLWTELPLSPLLQAIGVFLDYVLIKPLDWVTRGAISKAFGVQIVVKGLKTAPLSARTEVRTGRNDQEGVQYAVQKLIGPAREALESGRYSEALSRSNDIRRFFHLWLQMRSFANFKSGEHAKLLDRLFEDTGLGGLYLSDELILQASLEAQKIGQEALKKLSPPGTIKIVTGFDPTIGPIASEYDAREVGWGVTPAHLEERTHSVRLLLDELTPESRREIEKGDILLLGPGRHVHEILMLLEIFPGLKSGPRALAVVDSSWNNLMAVKSELDRLQGIPHERIKFYHADFSRLPFESRRFSASYSRSVFERTIVSPKEVGKLGDWLEELRRVSTNTAVHFTLDADETFFRNHGFITRSVHQYPLPYEDRYGFIADLDGRQFVPASRAELRREPQQALIKFGEGEIGSVQSRREKEGRVVEIRIETIAEPLKASSLQSLVDQLLAMGLPIVGIVEEGDLEEREEGEGFAVELSGGVEIVRWNDAIHLASVLSRFYPQLRAEEEGGPSPRSEVRRRRLRRHSSVLAPLSARAEVRSQDAVIHPSGVLVESTSDAKQYPELARKAIGLHQESSLLNDAWAQKEFLFSAAVLARKRFASSPHNKVWTVYANKEKDRFVGLQFVAKLEIPVPLARFFDNLTVPIASGATVLLTPYQQKGVGRWLFKEGFKYLQGQGVRLFVTNIEQENERSLRGVFGASREVGLPMFGPVPGTTSLYAIDLFPVSSEEQDPIGKNLRSLPLFNGFRFRRAEVRSTVKEVRGQRKKVSEALADGTTFVAAILNIQLDRAGLEKILEKLGGGWLSWGDVLAQKLKEVRRRLKRAYGRVKKIYFRIKISIVRLVGFWQVYDFATTSMDPERAKDIVTQIIRETPVLGWKIFDWKSVWLRKFEEQAGNERNLTEKARLLYLAFGFEIPWSRNYRRVERKLKRIYIRARQADYGSHPPLVREIAIKVAGESERIPGYLFIPRNLAPGEKAPVVVLYHGLTARKEHPYFDRLEKKLIARGIAVLRVDYPRHGEYKRHFEGPTHFRRYTQAIIKYLNDSEKYPQINGKELGLLGFSFGGQVALRTILDETLKDSFEAFVSMSPPIEKTFLTESISVKYYDFLQYIFEKRRWRSIKRKRDSQSNCDHRDKTGLNDFMRYDHPKASDTITPSG